MMTIGSLSGLAAGAGPAPPIRRPALPIRGNIRTDDGRLQGDGHGTDQPYVQVIRKDRTKMNIDDKTRVELEAAVYRRLVEHLRQRTDVQNIDLMNLAGFCRNCLSNWMKDAADAKGVDMTKETSRQAVYGMRYDECRAKYQRETSPDQKAAFDKAVQKH